MTGWVSLTRACEGVTGACEGGDEGGLASPGRVRGVVRVG